MTLALLTLNVSQQVNCWTFTRCHVFYQLKYSWDWVGDEVGDSGQGHDLGYYVGEGVARQDENEEDDLIKDEVKMVGVLPASQCGLISK